MLVCIEISFQHHITSHFRFLFLTFIEDPFVKAFVWYIVVNRQRFKPFCVAPSLQLHQISMTNLASPGTRALCNPHLNLPDPRISLLLKFLVALLNSFECEHVRPLHNQVVGSWGAWTCHVELPLALLMSQIAEYDDNKK